MTPERWKKLDALFQEAVELQGEARKAHLAKVCASDQQLYLEVEELLSAHEREGSFIDSPIFVLAPPVADEGYESLVGRNIGPYRVITQLGRGGMGEVYLAQDSRLGRKVAIKLLAADLTDNDDRVQRFEQEARAASALNHPNILTIHEVGKASTDRGDARYIVSEFVEGETLRTLLRGGKLDISQATAIAEQVASALSVAHEAGIIHRDIKPENVMVRPDGLVKVLDFGLAKLIERPVATEVDAQAPTKDGFSTTPGMVMGTASYMSPEQARGQQVDCRTDIFSLGVVLYEMVAGRRPFAGESTSDVIAAVLTAEPLPLSSLTSRVPVELERVSKKCLEKDRQARYQSAKELIAELKPLRKGNLTKETLVRRTAEGPVSRLATQRWILGFAAVALLTAGLGWFFYWRRSPVVRPGRIESLVVLPLENLSADPAQEYFADGMTDALIGDLAKIGALRVISRTSAMHYKGTKKSLPQIASELGVEAVVEGTVQRSGDRVLIRAQLIHATTDRHLWVETYERELRDVLKLQSEVAQTIAREIQIKVTPAEQARLTRQRPVNRKAFDDYLQGRYLYWNKRTRESAEQSIEYFQRAIKEDPAYAQAYAGLADSYNDLGSVIVGALLPLEARRLAAEAAVKALELDSELAEAHTALGHAKHYNWDWAAAEQEFKHAIELNPNYSNAHMRYGQYLVTMGDVEGAVREVNRARELDPYSLSISSLRGFVLENARLHNEAIEQFRNVLAVDPDNYEAYWHLGHTFAATRQFNEAIAASEKAASLSGRAPGALGFLGMAYGLAGRKAEANRVLNELLELSRRRYVTPVPMAVVYIGLGDKDQAFVWLEKAYQERSNFMAFLKVIPIADPLRSDPRFDNLLERIGLAK